jgi:hypothetical protein
MKNHFHSFSRTPISCGILVLSDLAGDFGACSHVQVNPNDTAEVSRKKLIEE